MYRNHAQTNFRNIQGGGGGGGGSGCRGRSSVKGIDRSNGYAGMLLNSQESDHLLVGFPTTRLSYEAYIHKNDKTPLDYERCFIIPKGRRCIVWITEWKRVKVVAVIEIMNQGQGQGQCLSSFHRGFQQENGWIPGAVRLYDACVDNTMAYGSVFGGTVFRLNTNTYFSVHTIYWYKGDSVPPLTLSEHIRLCERIFYENDIRQIAFTKHNSIVFGLPVLCYSTDNIDSVIENLPYQVFAIQFRSNSTTRVCQQLYTPSATSHVHVPAPVPVRVPAPVPAPTRVPISEPVYLPASANTPKWYIQPPDEMLTNIQGIFVVRPNIQNDVYELFVRPAQNQLKMCESTKGDFIFYNFAHIPNYKTSVMMNGYFRNIDENKRLDALEESDDESDFENVEPDKYVSLDKEYMMVCRFNKRFCRWVPIQMLSSTKTKTIPLSQVITYQQVKQHESKYVRSYHKRV